jgi:hypothetical protein
MFKILWRKIDIGELTEVSTDMWYLEGKWTPNGTPESKEFINELRCYNPKDILENPRKAEK